MSGGESNHSSVQDSGRFRDLLFETIGPLLGLMLIVVLFIALDQIWGAGTFASVGNLRRVTNTTSMLVVPALGMTIIIIAGGIDLSAGTALSLCATILALLLEQDVNIAVAVGLTVMAGCMCGMVNGSLISGLRIVPFIVTLGAMTIFLGVGQILSKETTVYPDRDQIPEWLIALCSTRKSNAVFDVIPNYGVILTVLLSIMVAAILRLTVFGRHVFALGSNESTARLCGINIPLTKIAVYVLAGFFVGIGGIYHFSNVQSGTPTDGSGRELEIIAAVVIGGGSLNGGRGSVIGTIAGAGSMATIRSGCDSLGVPNPWQLIIIGSIIIVAVAVDQFRQRRGN